jgi:nucleotide-binding universal stress UspA family protein
MFEKILVPLDGSINAEIVIPYVSSIGSRFSTEIILISVADPRIADVDQLHRSYLDFKAEQLQSIIEQTALKRCMVTGKVLKGRPSDEIIKCAENLKVDLIIMASRGSSGQAPPLLGHVSEKILWGTKKPVLLIKKENGILKKLLVPLDGSIVSETALPFATALASAFQSKLILFQAVEPLKNFAGYDTLTTLPLPKREDVKAAAISYLTKVQNQIKKTDFEILKEVEWGTAAESITDFAKEHQIDLICMSARGQSNINRWVFGSVTEKVLHAEEIPLFIVHPRK